MEPMSVHLEALIKRLEASRQRQAGNLAETEASLQAARALLEARQAPPKR